MMNGMEAACQGAMFTVLFVREKRGACAAGGSFDGLSLADKAKKSDKTPEVEMERGLREEVSRG